MLLRSSGLVEWDGGYIDFSRVKIVHQGLERLPTPGPDTLPATFVTGACMMVRRDAWNAVGGMREDLFLYHEDADFSMRVQRAGLHGGVVRCIQVVHESSGTVGRDSPLQIYLMTRNGIRFFREWSPHLWGRVASWVVVPVRILWRLVSKHRSLRGLAWILQGVLDARHGSSHHRFQGRAMVP